MRELVTSDTVRSTPHSWGRLWLAVAVLAMHWACCAQVGPVVVHGGLTRDEVIRQLGQPTHREVASAGDALQRNLIQDETLAARVRQLAPGTQFELLVWQARCLAGSGDYFIGLFDADTGKILSLSGEPLSAGRTQLD